MRQELTCALQHYFKNLEINPPIVSQSFKDAIANIVELTAQMRTSIPFGLGDQDASCEVEIAPEYATRLAKQCLKLAQLLAIVRQKTELTEEEYRSVVRVCLDTMPPKRFAILRELYLGNEPLIGVDVVKRTGFSRYVVEGSLKNLELIGLVRREENQLDSGRVDLYSLPDSARTLFGSIFQADRATGRLSLKPVLTEPITPTHNSVRMDLTTRPAAACGLVETETESSRSVRRDKIKYERS